MSNDQSSNIFDYSKKMGSGSKKKTPLPPNNPSLLTKPISDEEAFESLQKIKDIHLDIEMKIAQTCESNNITIDWVKNYLANPKNFHPEIWNSIQTQRESQMEKIWELLGVEEKLKHIEKTDKKQSKEKRAKNIGQRKRGWIPMS